MRSSMIMLALLGIAVTCGSIPCIAQSVEETVFMLRSVEVNDDVPQEVCDTGWDSLGLEGRESPDDPFLLVKLNAEVWAMQTRAADSEVVNSGIRRIGKAHACSWIPLSAILTGFPAVDLEQPLPQTPFYIEFEIGDLFLSAGGACLTTSTTIPDWPLVLSSCGAQIPPDENQKLLGGSAASSSVLNPLDIPGFHTGSFWTIRIFRETE